MLSLPATSIAAETSGGRSPESARSSADLLTVGAGYGHQAGSQPVRVLQMRLRTLGHEPGPIDGLFGPLTERAVQSFQRASGLVVDGVVGPRTYAAMRRAGPGVQLSVQRVRDIQRQLRAVGYEPGPVNGVYGPRTQAAVEHFQRAQGLTADGVARAQTVERLAVRHAAVAPERADRASSPVPAEAPRQPLAGDPGPPAFPDSAGHSPADDSSFSVLRPANLALIAALALVLLLTGIRAARRRERTSAPAPRPVATTGRAETRLNLGLAAAVLLGALVIGAAGGALFATRASPDDGARTTARSLVTRGAALSRPATPRAERPERERSAKPSATRDRRTAPTGAAVPSTRARPTSGGAPQHEPVRGTATAVPAAPREPATPPRRTSTEPDPLSADVALAPPERAPSSESDDLFANGSSQAEAARRVR